MRALARMLGAIAENLLTFISAVFVGAVGAIVGFVVGLIIFGLLGLSGWMLAIPALVLAAVGFAVAALATWGLMGA